MAGSEIVSLGAYLKQVVAQHYSQRGPAFGRAVAAEYMVEIANAVGEIDGREIAATMMFRATDAVLAKVPSQEIEGLSLSQLIENATTDDPSWGELGKRVNLKMGITQKLGWMLVGLLLSKPVFDMVHVVTGW